MPLHYNGDNSYLFVNGSQELKCKSSVNYLDRSLLCVGNISSDWSLTNSKKDGLYGICNDKDNPYFKVCLLDSIKYISVKRFDLLSKKNVLQKY